MTLIEIGLVVIEIQEVEKGELAVSVNNTLVCHMAFLTADTTVSLDFLAANTQQCFLIHYLGPHHNANNIVLNLKWL